ncbi:hypothetical protein B0H63DRAFT_387484 [Podospora didyma]|uniref:DUF7726 domain-containing protein n=1 Tax=Podospora didyma TaxID=330526 RepID=A0AAE0U750_9PEZI|nr:hypothetical protein B0H63DRAFT_387484 [Podospora didyma]
MPISSILSTSPGKENVPAAQVPMAKAPAPKPATAAAPATKKRKSTDQLVPESEINPEDVDISGAVFNKNCDQVRRMINNFLDAGAMTKTAFAGAIGVSLKSLNGFLGEHGASKGSGSHAYPSAWEYFTRREYAGLKMPRKKLKTSAAPAPAAATSSTAAAASGSTTTASAGAASSATAAGGKPAFNSAGVDISGITLPGEETDSVPLFDSCDEIRRKINAHLKGPGVTQAQFCRDILAQFKSENRPTKLQGSQLARFRGMKGPTSGAKSTIFYGAYVFFEKIRIKEGKNKTNHRLEKEKEWPEGIEREYDSFTSFICLAGERPVLDKYGKLEFI